MKTLREYIDQLDEISRRDFIKGAGATAGLAALGVPADSKAQSMTEHEKDVLSLGIQLFYVCQKYSANTDKALCDRAKKSLVNFANKTILGVSGLNEIYATTSERYNKILSTPDTDPGKQRWIDQLNWVYKNAETIIRAMDSQRPFNEEVDEAASPDAVARIEQLAQYK